MLSEHWPIDNAAFENAIALYRETELDEHLNDIKVRFLLPLCQHRYVARRFHRFDFLDAITHAMDECVERIKPAHLRRCTKRTGQPISGYDPSRVSQRTGKRVKAFSFFSSIARNANSDLNRSHTKEAKEHSEMLQEAYTLLRHAPAMGDNLGLLSSLTPGWYGQEEPTPEQLHQRACDTAKRALVKALIMVRTYKQRTSSRWRIQPCRVDSKGRRL